MYFFFDFILLSKGMEKKELHNTASNTPSLISLQVFHMHPQLAVLIDVF